jgi:Protein of unknown function (DUF5674)
VAGEVPSIVIVRERIDPDVLRTLLDRFFVDMVKLVVDVERRIVAIGGELHADCEHLLLEDGGRLNDLWGVNYYPGRGADSFIEYTALINIRPARGNRSMLVEDETLRSAIREIVEVRIGLGEALT